MNHFSIYYSSFAHSQPMKIEKTFCAHCHGPIEVFLNRKDLKGNLSVEQLKKPSAYAKFVKKNYGLVKKELPNSTQVEHMEILSKTFGEFLPVQNRRRK